VVVVDKPVGVCAGSVVVVGGGPLLPLVTGDCGTAWEGWFEGPASGRIPEDLSKVTEITATTPPMTTATPRTTSSARMIRRAPAPSVTPPPSTKLLGGVLIHSSKPARATELAEKPTMARHAGKSAEKLASRQSQTGGMVVRPPELVNVGDGLCGELVGLVFVGDVGEGPDDGGELGTGLFSGSGTREGGW
jgi:hypothetical protein